jgi:hypothetical protein
MHWTSLWREWGVQYSVLLDDNTEVDLLAQDDVGSSNTTARTTKNTS